MAQMFLARLINPPFEDPGLLISFRWEKRAILFDAGRLDLLGTRTLLSVSDVFISHTHVDHFIGFDHLLRILLARSRKLRVYGPRGIIENVRGKLRAYTWNLTEAYPLAIVVNEVDGALLRTVTLRASDGFRGEHDTGAFVFDGVLLEEERFQVCTRILDHKIPCLAFCLLEKEKLSVRKDALDASGLEPGPWLNTLKTLVGTGAWEDREILVKTVHQGEKAMRVRDLRTELLKASRGVRIAYVVDTLFSASNVGKVVELAKDADLFFCEAPFLDADRQQATSRYHLTAAQAGILARLAGARRLVPFHFSPRYQSAPEALSTEALEEARPHGACRDVEARL